MQTAEQYLQSRTRDAIALSFEIQESNGDLGYVVFIDPVTLSVNGEIHNFKSNAEAKAFILRRFW